MKHSKEICRGVHLIEGFLVNCYAVQCEGRDWVLIDSGLPNYMDKITRAARSLFGERPPQAIILTHGHIDHSGCARRLSERWNVPIYAHALEHPYITGRSDYPPPDPTVGGFHAQLSRKLSWKAQDLGHNLMTLPGSVEGNPPGMPGWRWLLTDGHSPGHVSLFRESDATLLAGDALETVNLDSWIDALTKRRSFWRGGTPFTYDWEAARRSVERLSLLLPYTVCAGHGVPISGIDTARKLNEFVRNFPTPRHGRYVARPARVGKDGVRALPEKPFDSLPLAAGAVATGAVVIALSRRKRGSIKRARRLPPRAFPAHYGTDEFSLGM